MGLGYQWANMVWTGSLSVRVSGCEPSPVSVEKVPYGKAERRLLSDRRVGMGF